MRREPFTTIERAFNSLVESDALPIDGSLHPGLPCRQMPISEVVTFLRDPQSPLPSCDSIWRALLAAPDREQWDFICLGLALPALRKAVSKASRIWPHDPDGIKSEAIDAFIQAIHEAKPPEARIFSTICNRVKTACRTYARDLARHARGPYQAVFESHAPAAPWSHVDLVLIRAVDQGIISEDEAILIGAFRLDGASASDIAKTLGIPAINVSLEEKSAEHRLATWLIQQGK